MIRVSIVEDHSTTRDLVLKLFRQEHGIVCVGAYANAEQAELKIPENLPDVVLMDINLPRRSGIDCIRKLKQSHPKIEFLMFTTYDDSDLIFKALQAGASGYLLKSASTEELVAAIREVYNGGSPMSPEIARLVVLHFYQKKKPAGDMEKLTPRENEILALLATEGLPYKLIADKFGISLNTVHAHLRAVYKKLHVQSRAEAVLKFLGR